MGVTLRQLTDIDDMLYKTYKNVGFKRLDFKAEHMGFIETMSKPLKTLEYKSQVVEEFLIYFYSTMEFHSSWAEVHRKMGFSDSLYGFASALQWECDC